MKHDEFSSDWQETLALLQDAHEEPIAPAHYASVRARVMGELARRERPLWARGWVGRWAWAAAGLVLAAAVGLRVDLRPRLEPPAVALAHPVAPVAVPAAKRPAVVHRAPRPASHRPVSQGAKAEPLLIQLVTDDPDVVIYWIADKRGDE